MHGPTRNFARFLLIFPMALMGVRGVARAGEGRGHITLGDAHFLKSQETPVPEDEGRTEIEYENQWKLAAGLKFHFHPFLRAETHPQAYENPVFFDPREIGLLYEKSSFFARVGTTTLHWEGTDGLNPMDIATMKEWGDPLDSQTRASNAIEVGRGSENFDWELAYIPAQTRSTLPGEESAWWPRHLEIPLRTDAVEMRLQDHIDYHLDSRQELDGALENNIAARTQLRTPYGDLAVGFFEGASESPILKPSITAVPIAVSPKQIYLLQSPVVITPIDYRRRSVSGLITVPVGAWIFRVSSRYDQPLGAESVLPTWSEQTVAGVERSVEIFDQTLTFVLEWAWTHHPEDTSLLSISDLFDEAVLWGARVPMGEKWLVTLSGFYSTRDHSSFTQALLTRKLSDEWSADLNAQILEGPSDSLLGVFSDNDRVLVHLTRAF